MAMGNTELKSERDEALYYAYRRVIAENNYMTQREAIEAAINSEAPQFFIPSKALSLHIGRIRRNCPQPRQNMATKRKLGELYDRYVRFMEENPDTKMRHYEICEMLVEQPAPEFYISAEMAKRIIRREGKRLNRLFFNRFSKYR